MTNEPIQRPDPEKVLSKLKPFQRDSVEHVFRRLYLDEDATSRFLVADEVGLGKTMVAKGVLAKAIDHLWDRIDRIDVVYICSNADIARQNINRLNLIGSGDIEFASRITLLPIHLGKLRERKLNFISFTPGTSFDLKSSMGVAEERRLIYWLLREAWGFADKRGPINVLQGYVTNSDWWANYVAVSPAFESLVRNDFINALAEFDRLEADGGRVTLQKRFDLLCNFFCRVDRRVTKEMSLERSRVIGLIRRVLAKTCLRLLEPDIVILDEFQRFKNLLSDEDEAGHLAQAIFTYADSHSEVKTLLLSATPYKMYTLYEESEDNHYKDFLDTLAFLEKGKDEGFEKLLQEYRQELFRVRGGQFENLMHVKTRIEQRLRRVISRKERITASKTNDDMLEDRSEGRVPSLSPEEIRHFLALQKISRHLEHGDMVEYWKSASYLLNFMDGYKVKRLLHEAMEVGVAEEISSVLASNACLLLPWEKIQKYTEVSAANARLQQLLADTVENGAWKLLWMPPSLPYYLPSDNSPFAEFAGKQLTKRLIFSSWNVVPKLIAAMVSYDAERRMFTLLDQDPEYSTEWRKNRGGLLKFTLNNKDLPAGMSALGIIYPSFTLARCGDPLKYFTVNREGKGARLGFCEVMKAVSLEVGELLSGLPVEEGPSEQVDERWYWAAPILLDLEHDRAAAESWLEQSRLDRLWSGLENADSDDKESRWSLHVEKARELVNGTVSLGRRPDDLVQVLALMALGGPAVVALRGLCRLTGGHSFHSKVCHRNAAAKIAWGFRSFFNRPETTCLIRGLELQQGDYWRRVLEYSAEGQLQAVLDEYIHVLREFLGMMDRGPAETVNAVAATLMDSLQLITAQINIERFENLVRKDGALRGHFALRFGVQQSEEKATEPTREDRVRQAFNSPFWPFVLASTSVGQEGLDFHPYCHAIVHWNLPNNPVDLEQREGRILRYKGHAVRKNVAAVYGNYTDTNGSHDPWESMFAAADQEHGEASRGMSPYWNFSIEGGAKVERYVPALPFSRDQIRYAALRKSLAVYRMVFGQCRQEDLVEYLLQHLSEADVATLSGMLQIDLSAPHADV